MPLGWNILVWKKWIGSIINNDKSTTKKSKEEGGNDISYQNQFLWRPSRLRNLDKAELSEPPLGQVASVLSTSLATLSPQHGLEGELAVGDDDLPGGLATKEREIDDLTDETVGRVQHT